MILKPRLVQWTQEQVDNILSFYPNKKFVMEYSFPKNPISVAELHEDLEWSYDNCLLFWEEDSGMHSSNYMIVFSYRGSIMVSSGQHLVDEINKGTIIGYKVSHDEVIYSTNQHDMVYSKDRQHFVDGGPVYTRASVSKDVVPCRLKIIDEFGVWVEEEPVDLDDLETDDEVLSSEEYHYHLIVTDTGNKIVKTNEAQINLSTIMEWTGNDIDYIKNICYLGYFTEKEFYKGVKE
jgi:hypothetical protein